MTRAARRSAWRLGHWAETVCVAGLVLRGYRILARRLRYPVGEVDIVAQRGRTVAFVEVKAWTMPQTRSATGSNAASSGRQSGSWPSVRGCRPSRPDSMSCWSRRGIGRATSAMPGGPITAKPMPVNQETTTSSCGSAADCYTATS